MIVEVQGPAMWPFLVKGKWITIYFKGFRFEREKLEEGVALFEVIVEEGTRVAKTNIVEIPLKEIYGKVI